MSKLGKYKFNTPPSFSTIKKTTLSGDRDGMVGEVPQGENTKASASIFTTKNIISTVVVFGLIFGGLKLAKAI